MLYVALLIRRLIRVFLKWPCTSGWMWKKAPQIRFALSNLYIRRFSATFEGDLKVWVSLKDHIESQLFWQGVQEGDRGEIKLLKALIKPHHIFFDIGANIGAFTLVAADGIPLGQVHAFEPSTYHLGKLEANLRLNRFDNVVVHPVALSDMLGASFLYFPRQNTGLNNTGMASQFPFDRPHSSVEKIKSVQMDDYVTHNCINRVDLIKIDVEGAELKVLLGGEKTISSSRPQVLMEISLEHLRRAQCDVEEILQFWRKMNYQMFKIENSAQLTPVLSESDLTEHQNIYCKPVELSLDLSRLE